MKKYILVIAAFSFLGLPSSQAQLLKKISGGNSADSSKKTLNVNGLLGGSKGTLSTDEIARGLREALSVGVTNGTGKLNALDGYFANAAIKVLMPPEAKKVEQTLRSFGLGAQVDKAILSMNRAAEDAAAAAAPIFLEAIKSMTIQDAAGILRGGENAATRYLQEKTTAALTSAFRPSIEKSLQKVDATKYWNQVFSSYNRFSKEKVNTDLPAYVTEKALAGIFYQVAEEEKKIRKDPAARTSELLKKVFANNAW